MTTVNEMLISQLETCLSETSWFATSNEVLKNVSLEEATWKDEGFTNSIVDIINHLTFWNTNALNKFKGIEVNSGNYTNEDTFFKNETISNANELELKIERFRESLLNWKEVLENCEIEKLQVEVYPGRPWWKQISSMLLHTAHHLGQIIYIRKRLGTWDPVKWDS